MTVKYKMIFDGTGTLVTNNDSIMIIIINTTHLPPFNREEDNRYIYT